MAVDDPVALKAEPEVEAPQGADDTEGVTSEFVADVVERLDAGDAEWLRGSVSDMWAADIADLLEALDPERRDALVAAVKDIVDPETFVEVDEDLYVVNMVAQHGIGVQDGQIPLRYDALRECLRQVAELASELDASVHMPRIGCGLAGGDWNHVEMIINQVLCLEGIVVAVYDFDG